MAEHHTNHYYVPEPSHWPLLGSLALFCLLSGVANWLHGSNLGLYLALSGALILIYMMVGWFGTVIQESIQGYYKRQEDHSFRWSMAWFIFSELMFFAAFFSALFYARFSIIPELAGVGDHILNKILIWPDFKAAWPLLHNPDNSTFPSPEGIIPVWGIPAINTLILLSSGVTITIAHHGLLKNQRRKLIIFLALTIFLGISFLALQAHEYFHAYTELNLKLDSGIYGTTFFMLTGFHGLHVTIGTIMLIIAWMRCWRGHFTPNRHFAFEAIAWYWHFVDVIWLFLFVFVYWL